MLQRIIPGSSFPPQRPPQSRFYQVVLLWVILFDSVSLLYQIVQNCLRFLAVSNFKSCFPHHEKTLVNQGFSSFLAPQNRALNTILNTIKAHQDFFLLFFSLFPESCSLDSSICLFNSKPCESRIDKEKCFPDPLFFPGQSSI